MQSCVEKARTAEDRVLLTIDSHRRLQAIYTSGSTLVTLKMAWKRRDVILPEHMSGIGTQRQL